MPTAIIACPEVSLPLATVSSLEAVLSDASPRLLTDLGQENGERLTELLQANVARDLATLPPTRFWAEVQDFFDERGWATLSWEQLHPGVGIVRSRPRDGSPFPARFFAATLEGFFSRILETRVAVVRLKDGDEGDEVTFAIGGPTTMARLETAFEETGGDLVRSLDRI